ncbi:hypothetical protein MMC25_007743 [Agyrium rufum]|nr:hypothetical protein [Agyrium rufum]
MANAVDGPNESRSRLDRILRQRRKLRESRACVPCRQRKVKCDAGLPCETCRKRAHTELCSYVTIQPQSGSAAIKEGVNASISPKSEPIVPRSQVALLSNIETRLKALDHVLLELKEEVRLLGRTQPDPTGSTPVPEHAERHEPAVSNETVFPYERSPAETVPDFDNIYVGDNSVPTMVAALDHVDDKKSTTAQDFGNSVIPLLGLKNQSLTYPFVDLWGWAHGSPARTEALYDLVPLDGDCLRLFRQYRDIAFVLFPGIIDIEQFETELHDFLAERSSHSWRNPTGRARADDAHGHGNNTRWLGLLFAVLASGAQCGTHPRRNEQYLTSQVYGV